MADFPLWAERLYNQPLALDVFKNEVLCDFARVRIAGTRPAKIDAQVLGMADEASSHGEGGRKDFAFNGEIAVLPIRGTLVHRAGAIEAASGLVGYNSFIRQARAASHDPDIKGIFVPIESGGGECAGLFAAAEELASMAADAGGKPIYAYLDERACSAAYVMASACDRIYGRLESTGGSIAALCNIIDTSKAFEKAGLDPIVIRAAWADRKAPGQPGEKIDKAAIAELQDIVDAASEQVAEFVAAMRGIPLANIKAMRGKVFRGPEMLKNGLLDDICSEREAWTLLKDAARSR